MTSPAPAARRPRLAVDPERSFDRATGRLVGRPMPHEGATANVTGPTIYLDDLPPYRNELLIELGRQPAGPCPHRFARRLRTRLASAGIAAVFTAADVPGDNHFGPIVHDEELLAESECRHIGQPIVALAGETRAALRLARRSRPARARGAATRSLDRPGHRRRRVSGPAAADRSR